MIGKPEWFTYRIFGWGIRPKTKEGWIYIIVAIAIFLLGIYVSPDQNMKMIVGGIIVVLLMLDSLHIMTQLSKVHDERENHHQLIIERNVSFAAIFAIAAIIVYQAYTRGEKLSYSIGESIPVDTSLLIVLGVMVVIKIVSLIYVKSKM